MNLLPRLVYLFRTLPISICMPDLPRFQNKVLRFIWGNKRPRVNKRTLYMPKLRGVPGVPDLAKYYRGAQLAQLIQVHSSSPPPTWMKLESSLHPTKPNSHLMWLQPKDRPVMMCPTFSFSLHLWERLAKPHGFKSPHTPMAPLVHNPAFTAGLHPHTIAW